MADVELVVDGKAYDGWKAVEVSRAIDAVSGAFALDLTERWAVQQEPWQITPGAACELRLDGETVITGHVDSVRPSYDANGHSVAVTGRDLAADLVDCSAVHAPDQWTNIGLDRLAKLLAEPFGVPVTVTGDMGDPFPVVKLEHGETAWEALERHARQRGVLVFSDGRGGMVLANAGQQLAESSLIQGQNILSASGELNHVERYSVYTVTGQSLGDDGWDAEASAHITGQATDPAIVRYRPLRVICEALTSGASAGRRAAWESTVRAGRSARASIVVAGWRQSPNGPLWQLNQLVPVVSPWLQINGLMLVTGLRFRKGDGGSTTSLELMSPAAFRPDLEPRKKQRKQDGTDLWGTW